jgi:hypothetical protein
MASCNVCNQYVETHDKWARENDFKKSKLIKFKAIMEKYIRILAEHQVDSLLDGYEIAQKSSSNVDYYGSNGIDTIFIQFKSGGSYLYLNVDNATIDEMHATESIGKFIGTLSKKYTYTKIDRKLVWQKEQADIAAE